VIDLSTRQLVERWPLPDVHVAHAIALDEGNSSIIHRYAQTAPVLAFNIDTGKVVASLPCVGVNSDMWVDFARKQIYVTGSETASVFKQQDADHYEHMAEVPTAYRAKSSMFVPG